MTAEINYASEFGIDFWAFCAYPIGCKDYATPVADCPKIQCCADNYALSYALNLYLTNPNNHKVLTCNTASYVNGIRCYTRNTLVIETSKWAFSLKFSFCIACSLKGKCIFSRIRILVPFCLSWTSILWWSACLLLRLLMRSPSWTVLLLVVLHWFSVSFCVWRCAGKFRPNSHAHTIFVDFPAP